MPWRMWTSMALSIDKIRAEQRSKKNRGAKRARVRSR